jgi:hypothetical protein
MPQLLVGLCNQTCNTVKLLEPPKAYATNCTWKRVLGQDKKLGYGDNA